MDNKRTIQTLFLFGLLVLLFALLVRMFFPFFTVILWGILLYILVRPVHAKAAASLDQNKKFYDFKRHMLAAVFSLGTIIVIVGPLIGILFMLVHQVIGFLKAIELFVQQNPRFFEENSAGLFFAELVEKLTVGYVKLETSTIRSQIMSLVQKSSTRIFSFGSSVVSQMSSFIISFVFTIFTMFFFFLDGKYLAGILGKAIPIEPRHMKTLTEKFTEITRHLFSGYILVALYQGIVAFVLMKVFGVQAALLFAVVLMFASFIPIFGAAIVWVPVGIGMCFSGPLWKGILFLILAGIGISFLDNFLRPLFLKDRIKVHPLLIFFTILGGIKIFGMNGLLLGPMVIILFFTVLDMITLSPSALEPKQKQEEASEHETAVQPDEQSVVHLAERPAVRQSSSPAVKAPVKDTGSDI